MRLLRKLFASGSLALLLAVPFASCRHHAAVTPATPAPPPPPMAAAPAAAPAPAPAPAAPAATLPDRLTDKEFWELTTQMSEPNGSFRSDNLLSNEIWLQYVIP